MRTFAALCLAASASAFQLYQTDENPFTSGAAYYVNPSYQKELQTSIDTTTDSSVKQYLQNMSNEPSAYWIDTKSKVTGDGVDSMEGILKDAKSRNGKQLVTFIVYDTPNRDCHAKASNGEICCTYNADKTCNYTASGNCSEGINEYKTQYIDPMFKVLEQFQNDVDIVLIIEPDSLPNIATNMADPNCGNQATQASYKEGITYAINKFADLKLAMYLDAAHGGWIGWEDNTGKFIDLLKTMDFDLHDLRGFSTNVANYQPLGEMCPWQSGDGTRNDYCLMGQHQGESCCSDPCRLESQWNPANNEMNFALSLSKNFQLKTGYSPKFVIDTGRNGQDKMRQDCSNWCNIRGAGVGVKSTAATAYPDLIDAYFWLKTPGESDGCTQTLPSGDQCPRYDSFCGSQDSLGSRSGEPHAPEAGQWFDYQIKQLAKYGV